MQTASVAVMATGMVLVIVTRNIDLSVGSMLGFVGMIMGVMQAEILPSYLGFGHPAIWVITLVCRHGRRHRHRRAAGHRSSPICRCRPSSSRWAAMLVWRGAAWWVTSGRTVAPMDPTFR